MCSSPLPGASPFSCGTCTIDVAFSPSSVGPKTGVLTITSDATSSPDTVDLSGNGVAGEVGLNPSPLDFGYQQVSATSTPRTVTLTNTGGADLHLGALTITGQFALASNTCDNLTLAPNATCTFGVTFSPLSLGAKTGQVTIPSDAASSPNSLALSGNGIINRTLKFTSNGVNDGTLRESAKDSGICNYIENPRSPLISVGDDYLRRQWVSILDFDTSSLPDNAVITGVKLSVKAMILQNDTYLKMGELTADVTNPFFGTLALLEKRDFEVRPLVRNVGTFTHAPHYYLWISMNMKPTSLSAINKTGHTQFRLHFQKKYSDDRIKQAIRFLSGDFWIPDDRPKLVISYYVP